MSTFQAVSPPTKDSVSRHNRKFYYTQVVSALSIRNKFGVNCLDDETIIWVGICLKADQFHK
jgi:hypothetical protein